MATRVKRHRRGRVRVKAYKRKPCKRDHFSKAKKTKPRAVLQRSYRMQLEGLERKKAYPHDEPDYRF